MSTISFFYDLATYDLSEYDGIGSSAFVFDALSIPTNLKIYSLNDNELKLTWGNPVSVIASGYNIYRSYDTSERFDLIATTTGVNYTDTNLTRNNTYYYRVTSLYSSGYLDYRDGFNYLPTNVVANPENGKMTILWSGAINPVDGYNIYRANNYMATLLPIGYTTDLTYIDSGLDTSLPYYYRVTSVYT